MKIPSPGKILPLLVLALLIPALAAGAWLALALRGLPDVAFLADPKANITLTVADWQGTARPFVVGPGNPSWVPLAAVSAHLVSAVRAGEDFSFYTHKGVDWFEVRESFKRNLREGRFARGASTITQQVAKNLFLTRDKTIRRKVRELMLARQLERALTKDRILELYLNLVELGDGVFGVGAGAQHHLDKLPADLTVLESAFLAAMLPGPKRYNPDTNPDRVAARIDHILAVMLKGRMITEDEYELAQDRGRAVTGPASGDELTGLGGPSATPETSQQITAGVSDEPFAGKPPIVELPVSPPDEEPGGSRE